MSNNQLYSVSRFRYALIHFITGQAAQMLVTAAHLLIIVRILSVSDYGVYMLVLGIPEMVLFLASFGILNLGQRYIPQLAGTIKNNVLLKIIVALLLIEAGILIVLSVISMALWPMVTEYFRLTESQSRIIYFVLPLVVLIPIFRIICEFLDALLEQKSSQILRTVMPLGRIVFIITFVIGDLVVDLHDVLLIDICVTGTSLIVACFILAGKIRSLLESEGSPPDAKEMMRFAWHMAPVNILSAASAPGTVRLVAAGSLGIVEIGLFGFLQSIRQLVLKVLPGMLLRGLVRPILINRTMAYGKSNILEYGTNLLWKINNLIIGAIFILVIIAGDYLVFVASGGKYEDAGVTLLLMIVVLSISSQRLILNMMLQIIGHTEIFRRIIFISPLALFVIWLLADWGLNSIIIILGISIGLSNGIVLLMLKKQKCIIMLDWRGNLKIIVSVGVASLLGLLFDYFGWNRFIAAACALLIYIAALYVLKPLCTEELRLLEKGIGGRLYKYINIINKFSCKYKT